MSWTKLQLITQAYTSIGLADYVFDLEPGDLQSACIALDSLVGSWTGLTTNIGYNLSDSPDTTDVNQESGVPTWCNAAIYLNLAILLAQNMRVTPPPTLVVAARVAYNNMRNAATPLVVEQQVPANLPLGAGQKYWRNYSPFTTPATTPLSADPGTELDLG